MKIEIAEQRPLNDKEVSFIETTCQRLLKECGGDMRKFLELKSSINSQYQVFITLNDDETNTIEDKASFLTHNLINGLKKPVRSIIINGNTIGVQIFDELRNKSLIKDAVGHIINEFDVQKLGDPRQWQE